MYKTSILAILTLIGIAGMTSVFASDISSTTISNSTFTILAIPIIHMNDTIVSSGFATYSGEPTNAEFASPTSQLIGDKIDTITLKLRKTGSPTGTAQIGIFNADLSVKKLFGTKDVATLTGTYTDYSFNLPSELYTISSGDRIGIKFTGGNSTNNVAVMRDTDPADPFDGIKSYHTYYDTTWRNATANDLYMILKQIQPDTGGTVGLADLAPNSVDSSKIVDGSIVNLDISPSAAILLTKLAFGLLPSGITINSANIVDGSIVNADLSNLAAIDLSKLATGALPAGITINSANIVNGSITADDIASNSIVDHRLGIGTNWAYSGQGRECTLGEIILTAGSIANGVPANGQILSINQNLALFSLLGTTYGGNGITNFALPDLRNVAPNGLTYSICTAGIYPVQH